MSYQALLLELVRFRGEESASRRHRNANQNLRRAIASSSLRIRCANLVDLHPTATANLVHRVSKTSTAQSLLGDAFEPRPTLLGRHHQTTCLPSFDAQAIRSPVPMKYPDTHRRQLRMRYRSTSIRRSCRPSDLRIQLRVEHRLVVTRPTHSLHRTTPLRTYV